MAFLPTNLSAAASSTILIASTCALPTLSNPGCDAIQTTTLNGKVQSNTAEIVFGVLGTSINLANLAVAIILAYLGRRRFGRLPTTGGEGRGVRHIRAPCRCHQLDNHGDGEA